MQCETDKTENKSAMETTKYKVNSIVKRKQLNFQGTSLKRPWVAHFCY